MLESNDDQKDINLSAKGRLRSRKYLPSERRAITVIEAKLKALTDAVMANTATIKTQNANIEKITATIKTQNANIEKILASINNLMAQKTIITEMDIRSLFGSYLDAASDKATKKRLIETIKPLLVYFKVNRITEINEAQRKKAMDFGRLLVNAFEEGGIDAAEKIEFPFT